MRVTDWRVVVAEDTQASILIGVAVLAPVVGAGPERGAVRG